MDCLDGLISSGFTCDSGNEAPRTLKDIGISETMITRVIGDEYTNAQELFDQKLEFSKRLMFDFAAMEYSKNTYNASAIESRTVGKRMDGTKPAYAGYGGYIMEVDNDLDVGVNINKIAVQLQHDGDVEFKIWNIETGVELWSETITIASGVMSYLQPNILVKSRGRKIKVAIGYDKTGIVSNYYKMSGDCTSCPAMWCGKYVKGYGADFDTSTWEITRNGHNSGMSIDYSLACLYEQIVCANRHMIAVPLLYKVGAELMGYALTTYRFNDTDEKKFQQILSHCAHNYDMSMRKVFENIRVPNNACYGCNPRFGAKTITP